jgi:hypothetical protein
MRGKASKKAEPLRFEKHDERRLALIAERNYCGEV